MANNANAAKRLLVHYFRLLARKNDIGWDSDNDMEVEQIVDLIIAAAVDEVRVQRDEADEGNLAWDDYKYRREQAEAWAKAERGES
jgi:hypothetical protein